MLSSLRFYVVLAFIIFIHLDANAQKSINISEVAAQNLSLENSLPKDSLQYYPYCTVSISVFNFDKLNKKEFRNQSSKLESFVLNAGIKGKSICPDELNVPVFVVNYEKDKYTQITHQQGVLINKLLVNKDGQDYPTISIFPKTVERTKNAFYINALQQVAILLKNTTSLSIVANVSNITDAFSQYINGLCTDEESDYEWSFPVIPATDLTRPYKVDMFVIKPNISTYAGGSFYIHDGKAYSVSSGNEYTHLPYILVTTSFSGYLADDKLPSTLAIESIDKLSLDASTIKLYSDISRLSKDQFDAEAQLLDKYQSYERIKDLVALIPQYSNNEAIKTQALNEWMAYRKEECPANYFHVNDVFARQNTRLDGYTGNLVSQIGFYHPINNFMNMYFNCAGDADTGDALATYYKYHDMFMAIPFIRNSQIFINLNSRINEMESVIYQNNFAGPLNALRKTLKSDEISDKEKLQNGRDNYNVLYSEITNSSCRTCSDSVFKVLSMYDQLDNNKLAINRTQDIIACSRYMDTLTACEGNIEASIKSASLKPDRKKAFISEKELLEKEVTTIKQEKSIFSTMPIQPKNEFKSEKIKIENEIGDTAKLISEVRVKFRS